MRTQLQNFGGDDPIWSFVAQLRTERFTGSAHIGTNPRLRLFVADGRVYFAEREGDPAVGTRLVNFGVLSATQLERGAVHVGDVMSLARLFHRDPTIDRDAVELTIEMATEKLMETVAQQPVATVELFPLRHHSSGIHLWTRQEPLRVYEPTSPAAPPVVEPEPVANEPKADVADDVAEPVAVEPVAVEPVAVEPVADEPVADEPVNVVAVEPVAVEPVADVVEAAAEPAFQPAEPAFQPASLSIPSLRPEPEVDAPAVPALAEMMDVPAAPAELEPEPVTEAAAEPEPEPVAEADASLPALATEPDVAGTPSLLAVLRAEEPRPEPRRDSAASLLAALRDEPAPSETITEVVPVVPADLPAAADIAPEVHEPAPAAAQGGLTSLSALAPLTAPPAPAAPLAAELHEPFSTTPATPATPAEPAALDTLAEPEEADALAEADLPSLPGLDAPADTATPVAPSASLPHLAAAPTAVPRRPQAEDSLPQIPADADLPRLGTPGSAAVPATTAAAAPPAEMAQAPDLNTWTPAAQNMAAVQIWELVDELTVPEVEPLLVSSGASDDHKSRGWRKGRKG